MHQHVLVEEVYLQAIAGMNALDTADRWLRDEQERQNRFVWVHVQAFLTLAAMASKMLRAIREVTQGPYIRASGRKVQL